MSRCFRTARSTGCTIAAVTIPISAARTGRTRAICTATPKARTASTGRSRNWGCSPGTARSRTTSSGMAWGPMRSCRSATRIPSAPPDATYKALGVGGNKHGLYAFKSADGIHWTLMHAGAGHHAGSLRLAQPRVLGRRARRVPRVSPRLSRRTGHPHLDVAGFPALDRAGVSELRGQRRSRPAATASRQT